MFSERDKEYILHIRTLFSQNGEMPEYQEDLNAIKFSVNGKFNIHHFCISCHNNVLKIFSLEKIEAHNSSNEVLKHIMNLNLEMQMGSFCYIAERDCFVYYLGVPLYEKPEKKFVGSIIKYTVDILDDHIPEIISCIHGANHWKKEGRSPTFH